MSAVVSKVTGQPDPRMEPPRAAWALQRRRGARHQGPLLAPLSAALVLPDPLGLEVLDAKPHLSPPLRPVPSPRLPQARGDASPGERGFQEEMAPSTGSRMTRLE